MEFFVFSFFLGFLTLGFCKSDIAVGFRITMAIPPDYDSRFVGRAFLMNSYQRVPSFRAALSVEAIDAKYACSLDVFLGDERVWSSGHFDPFYTTEKCVLEFSREGELQLEDPSDRVGWRTGTSRQGVERLQLMKTGNLVLIDAHNGLKWQSFSFPNNVLVWGQRLDVGSCLTSFAMNSSTFFSFNVQIDKVTLYLNSGKTKYAYWEFAPSMSRRISYIELGTKGLEFFNHENHKIAQILSDILEPVLFSKLGTKTGNLGLYHYSQLTGQFEASFQALKTTCDLPLACNPYGICTFPHACSYTEIANGSTLDCSSEKLEIIELESVGSVLTGNPVNGNVSKEGCASLCLDDCNCAGALYSKNMRKCFVYCIVRGLITIQRESGLSYLVKVPKGTTKVAHGKTSGLRKWILVVVGVVDGLIILFIIGGCGYCVIRKSGKSSLGTNNTPASSKN